MFQIEVDKLSKFLLLYKCSPKVNRKVTNHKISAEQEEFSTFLYEVEAWSLNKDHLNKLESSKCGRLPRNVATPWTDKVSNTEIPNKM